MIAGAFMASYVVLWILTLLLSVLVVLMYRHFGLMLMPGGKRVSMGGFDVGEKARGMTYEAGSAGQDVVLTWSRDELPAGKDAWFVVFGHETCPICQQIWDNEALPLFSEHWPNLAAVWVDSAAPEHSGSSAGWEVGFNRGAARAMEVPAYPFAYVIAPGGLVQAKGVVNDLLGLETIAGSGVGERADGASTPVNNLEEIGGPR